jgi:hypothetical protein
MITSCSRCGTAFESGSERRAPAPGRLCWACFCSAERPFAEFRHAIAAAASPPPPLEPHDPLLAGLSLREIVGAMRAAIRRAVNAPEDTITAGYAEELLCALELRVSEAITRRMQHASQRRGHEPATMAATELESLREDLQVFLRTEGF